MLGGILPMRTEDESGPAQVRTALTGTADHEFSPTSPLHLRLLVPSIS